LIRAFSPSTGSIANDAYKRKKDRGKQWSAPLNRP
jgi:hypothetical protein